MTEVGIPLQTPEQAHRALVALWQQQIRPEVEAGHQLWLSLQPLEDARSLRQNAFLWGVVYRETSEQAQIAGQKYTPDAWHELGKRLHLPRVPKKVNVAGKKRPVVTTAIGSTAGLSVKAMSEYIDRFTAWAVSDFGVVFSARLPDDLRPRPRVTRKRREAIDIETGEIMEVN